MSKNLISFYKFIPIFFVLTVLIIWGCTSVPSNPPCINKSANNSTLVFGEMQNGIKQTNWKLFMNGKVEKLSGESEKFPDFDNEIYVFPDSLCSVMEELGILIIEIQSLNVPAKNNCFVEYVNPERNYYFRAIWNPELPNEGNDKFQKFYNRLVKIINTAN